MNAAYLENVKREAEDGTLESLCDIVDLIDKVCADLGIVLPDDEQEDDR